MKYTDLLQNKLRWLDKDIERLEEHKGQYPINQETFGELMDEIKELESMVGLYALYVLEQRTEEEIADFWAES